MSEIFSVWVFHYLLCSLRLDTQNGFWDTPGFCRFTNRFIFIKLLEIIASNLILDYAVSRICLPLSAPVRKCMSAGRRRGLEFLERSEGIVFMKPALAELKIFFSHIKKLIFRNGIVWAVGLHNDSNFSADSIRKCFKSPCSHIQWIQCFSDSTSVLMDKSDYTEPKNKIAYFFLYFAKSHDLIFSFVLASTSLKRFHIIAERLTG